MAAASKVLVVEDEGIIARHLEVTLANLGYEVVAAVATGEEAIEAAQRARPAVVVMDIRLAGKVDGVQAAAAIQADLRIPVVYLTAHSDDETLARAKRTDPFAYVVKPFHGPELRAAIEIALRRHQIETQLREQDSPGQVMTVREVADYLNVDERTVYRTARRRGLPGFKVAGTWRFRRGDIDAWISTQTQHRGSP